jgi:hypothetical protein
VESVVELVIGRIPNGRAVSPVELEAEVLKADVLDPVPTVKLPAVTLTDVESVMEVLCELTAEAVSVALVELPITVESPTVIPELVSDVEPVVKTVEDSAADVADVELEVGVTITSGKIPEEATLEVVAVEVPLVVVPLVEATLDEATLDEATLDEATLDEATLDEATLDEATLDEATLVEATLVEATLVEVTLVEVPSVVEEAVVVELAPSATEVELNEVLELEPVVPLDEAGITTRGESPVPTVEALALVVSDVLADARLEAIIDSPSTGRGEAEEDVVGDAWTGPVKGSVEEAAGVVTGGGTGTGVP